MLSNSGINKVLLVGQITSQPFVNSTVKDQRYILITLVTNENIKRGDENVEHCEYHKVKVPEKLLLQDKLQLQPGQTIYMEGKIQTTSIIDEDRIKRYNLEILVSKIEVLRLVAVPV